MSLDMHEVSVVCVYENSEGKDQPTPLPNLIRAFPVYMLNGGTLKHQGIPVCEHTCVSSTCKIPKIGTLNMTLLVQKMEQFVLTWQFCI